MPGMIRLARLLAGQGVTARKHAGRLAAAGRIAVNGEVERDVSRKIDPQGDRVTVDGRAIGYRRHLYLMMNKPGGIVSATTDPKERTVLDLLPAELRRPGLFPAGRLDKDTEGLLIITDDGVLAHGILSPKKHVDKTYRAVLDGPVGEKEIEAFGAGLTLGDGTLCRPARLSVTEEGGANVAVVLSEGKYHQVKRMFRAVGREVLTLKRVAMGGLALDPALKAGETRPLTDEEVRLLQNRQD